MKFCAILNVSLVCFFLLLTTRNNSFFSSRIAGNKQHMNYFSRQIISREVEVEKMRRAGPKFKNNETRTARSVNAGKENVPNHLRTLNPKYVQQHAQEQVSKQVSLNFSIFFFYFEKVRKRSKHVYNIVLECLVLHPPQILCNAMNSCHIRNCPSIKQLFMLQRTFMLSRCFSYENK